MVRILAYPSSLSKVRRQDGAKHSSHNKFHVFTKFSACFQSGRCTNSLPLGHFWNNLELGTSCLLHEQSIGWLGKWQICYILLFHNVYPHHVQCSKAERTTRLNGKCMCCFVCRRCEVNLPLNRLQTLYSPWSDISFPRHAARTFSLPLGHISYIRFPRKYV